MPQVAHNLPETLHPVLRRIYLARNLTNAAELDYSLKQLLSLENFKGLDQAAALIETALIANQHILVVADFDADGATSCTLLIRALRMMGANHINYVIPNRQIHGYGLTPEIVQEAQQFSPDLLITVDNGISSNQGVAAAQALGIKVLITDHHIPGQKLPGADAIVNPNCIDNNFASKKLAGVGVIFYVMLALRARLRAHGWFNNERLEPNLSELLDLVALGTVADVVPLDYNNRILVAQGLKRIRSGKACLGINALFAVAGCNFKRATTTDLGYFVGPRLNAAGRLEDMRIGVECLLADDIIQAQALAERLAMINRERRSLEAEMQEQALAILDELNFDNETDLPWGIVLHDENWHLGIIGILSSRIRDRFDRPVITFAPSSATELRGSARSIPKLHIRDILESIATHYPSLIHHFGGHAAAAGLTIDANQLELFAQLFEAEVHQRITDTDLTGVVFSDGMLQPDDFNVALAELLRNAGPWGQGFPEPIFDGNFRCLDSRMMNDRHLKLKVRAEHKHNHYIDLDAMFFNFNNYIYYYPKKGNLIHLAYRLNVNQYNDNYSLQLLIEYLEIL